MEDRVQDKELGMGSLSLEKGQFKGGTEAAPWYPQGSQGDGAISSWMGCVGQGTALRNRNRRNSHRIEGNKTNKKSSLEGITEQ